MPFLKVLPPSRVKPAMDAPTLRWGVLGSGWIAAKFTGSVKAHTAQNIAAVGSRTQQSADAFAARWGLEKAYGSYEALAQTGDIDVIYVATPHNAHYENVLQMLESGKHVLVEKPMALNHAQAAEMVDLARRKGLFFAEALWTYFLPKFDVLQQVFDSSALGKIKSVYTEYGEFLPRDHRIFNPKLAGGPLLDLGTYPVSLVSKLMGVPDRVVGLGQTDPSGVNGQLSVVMSDAQGNLGTVSATVYGFSPTNAAIIGTEGALRFASEFHLPGSFQVTSADGQTVLTYDEQRGLHFDGLYFEAAEVARCIAEGKLETPCRPLDASLETMATLDKIRQCVGIDFSEAGLQE